LTRQSISRDHTSNLCSLLQLAASHFLINDDFAAPVNGLPVLLIAFSAQIDALPSALSPLHFFRNNIFAALDSALPFLPTALASHSETA
jgi:hypothetical protein